MLYAALIALALSAADPNPFDIARKPKQTVAVSLSEAAPTPETLAEPAMLRRIHGLLAEFKAGQIADLYNTVDPKPQPATPEGAHAQRICVVHISGGAGDRSVAIDQFDSGNLIATIIAPAAGAKSVALKRAAIDALLSPAGYTGPLVSAAVKDPRAEVFEVPRPYQHALFTLDGKTNADRFGSAGSIRYGVAKRDLGKESMFARLPKNYDPRTPAGLLVFMDPTPAGKPWAPMSKALDQLNLVCISAANTGNDREVSERLQLALDAVATARRRWHIDDARIYVTGVFGGGKMSSILLCCFPDVFTGAVPIVGLSTFSAVPTGEGRKVWRADFTRPSGKRWDLLLTRRLAPVTGDKDFNHAPVAAMSAQMQMDKLDVRLFDIAGLAHEFPSEGDFVTQLTWVDEKPRAARESAAADAAAAFAKAATPSARLDVVRRYPWTPAAWQAVESAAR